MRRPARAFGLIVVVAAIAAALIATISARGREPASAASAGSWRGLVGGPRALVPNGQRSIVVLRTPSLGQRLAKVGYATEARERAWTSQAAAAQQEVLTTLAIHGILLQPEFTYRRVLDGFSAALDPRAIALLDQLPEVLGVYPVRPAFPASISERLLTAKGFGLASGHRPDAGLPVYDGRGVTVGLLDTGVDLAHPYLRGRLLPGYDIVGGGPDASARANPQDPTQLERHGTEMAGIIAGVDGPDGLHGVAPGATILPIRVAGWQPAADGSQLVYARSDQLLAGLERAVDPNGDGDAHDAVRVAVTGVVEPYAAFTEGPEAWAAQGALDLGTLLVAPAGNDGAAGPSFGSVAGPAGGAATLAVGATDSLRTEPLVRVVMHKGLDVVFDRRLPLAGAVAPRHSLTLLPVAGAEASGVHFFDAKGFSLVAGRAVLAPVGSAPADTVAAAARAGAGAVLLYGGELPPGGLQVDERQTVPVVVVPPAAALELLAAERAGLDVGIAIGPADADPNAGRGDVTSFSSQGLAFDGSMKPDVVAPGVALETAEPGTAPDGSALYGTVNGTSGAAATVAGAAAQLAQMRPALDASSLRSLLAGYAQQGRASPFAVGGGTLRLGAAAVGEVASVPATLGFGIWTGPRWHATRTITVRNVSSRRLQLSVSVVAKGDSEALQFTVSPSHFVVGVGRARRVKLTVRAPAAPGPAAVAGSINLAAAGSEPLHVPWGLQFEHKTPDLLTHVSLDSTSFAPSDTAPALLTLQAGALTHDPRLEVEAVSRLDVLLYTAAGKFVGVLSRLRNLLPGSYSFGITGRGPTSARLPAGDYELRLAAWPTLPKQAEPSRAQVRFTIK
jgi:Subtilase family